MPDRTDAILESLLDVQRELLANQKVALEQSRQAIDQQRRSVELQREAVARGRRFARLVVPLVLFAMLAVLLPYLWQWVRFVAH